MGIYCTELDQRRAAGVFVYLKCYSLQKEFVCETEVHFAGTNPYGVVECCEGYRMVRVEGSHECYQYTGCMLVLPLFQSKLNASISVNLKLYYLFSCSEC